MKLVLNEGYAPSASELARFMRNAVKGLLNNEATLYWKDLGNGLALCVGWSSGYGSEIRDDVIQDKNDPDWGVNAGIKAIDSDYMKTDFDYLNFPYYDNGDVEDISVSIVPNEDYEDLASWFLKEYDRLSELEIEDDGHIITVTDDDFGFEGDEDMDEAYMDLDDDTKEYKYKGQPVYRIIGNRMEGDRTQMFAIGKGKRLEDENEFEPVVRSARYTTEESFLFMSPEAAEGFLTRFKKEYPDAETEGLHVAEYNPLYPIIKIVKISSPCGKAYIGIQEVPEEKMKEREEREAEREKDSKNESLNEALYTTSSLANEMKSAVAKAVDSSIVDNARIERLASIIVNAGVTDPYFLLECKADINPDNKKNTVRLIMKFAHSNTNKYSLVFNGGAILNDSNPNYWDFIHDKEFKSGQSDETDIGIFPEVITDKYRAEQDARLRQNIEDKKRELRQAGKTFKEIAKVLEKMPQDTDDLQRSKLWHNVYIIFGNAANIDAPFNNETLYRSIVSGENPFASNFADDYKRYVLDADKEGDEEEAENATPSIDYKSVASNLASAIEELAKADLEEDQTSLEPSYKSQSEAYKDSLYRNAESFAQSDSIKDILADLDEETRKIVEDTLCNDKKVNSIYDYYVECFKDKVEKSYNL